MLKNIAILTVLAAAMAGCATDEYQRIDGITSGAGNAIAANTVMQMVDPWPIGVDDTDLEVPADPSVYKKTAAAAATSDAGAGAAAGTTSN